MNRTTFNGIVYALMLLLFAHLAFANLTASVNQTDYYFLVGEAANIPLAVDNTNTSDISALLTYTITQEIKQGNFQYASTNTQSSTMTIPAGKNTIGLNFGTSNQPLTLKVNLAIAYTDKEEKQLAIDGITINYVSNQSQKQNQEQQKEGKETTQQQNQQQSQQNQQNSQQQSIQQQINNMLNQMNQQPKSPPGQNSAVQNNQLPQDSNALKQQMQKQAETQQQMNEAFQKEIQKNPDYQKMDQALKQAGYNQTSMQPNPTSNNSGDFQANYQKGQETATLKGTMNNGTMTDLQKTSSEDANKALSALKNDKRFQKYDKELQQQGYLPAQPQITQDGNKTHIDVQYSKPEANATITANIENNKVNDVTVTTPEKKKYWTLLLLGILFLIAGLLYFLHTKKKKKRMPFSLSLIAKPIDHKKEALRLLSEAKKLYADGHEKNAYGKAGEAIRFYYIHTLELKREATNTEIIRSLAKKEQTDVRNCLHLTSLVQFAKYKPNKKDFDEIVDGAENLIK